MTWFTALAVVAMSLAVWLVALPRVRVADPDAPRFGALVSRRSTMWVGATAAAVSGVLWLVPAAHHWLWVPYLAVGVPLVAVDVLTTFLPKQLNHLGGLLMLAGLVPLGLADWRAAAGAVVGGAAALAFFYLAGRVAATLGFGDVR
ncbi:hypothetical protein ACFQ06_14870, partial [Tessaracoccus lubricantis]